MPIRLITVSNRLPVTFSEKGIQKSSGGLVAALEGLSEEDYSVTWLGWPGGEILPERQPEVERALREEHGSVPIFLSAEEAEAHYEGFSNSSVWPLMHYMPTMFRYEPHWWDAYRDVNRRFADKVLSIARDGDLVWVHDYQLMLVPAMVKRGNPTLRVGFFLHTPFPSYEVFRCHPKREELVTGMLGADLVGFHTFGYLRHFRSAVLRLLGIESDLTTVRHGGRASTLGIYPIGINAARFDRELDSPGFREAYERFAQTHAGMRVVLSVERLDYTKGILQRMDAIELFLKNSEDRDKVKFVFISVPSRENVGEYRELREELEYRVGRLNGEYATLHNSPIRFIHGSVEFTELCALYAQADVGLVTPLVDGMNLVAKEYVAAQRDDGGLRNGNGPGVLVLSEFAGAAEELFSAVTVNPYDTAAVADAIARALAMPANERRRRMAPMRERVMSFDARAWARSFIRGLLAPPAPSARGPEPTNDDPREVGRRLARAVADGRRVALFLDYDGTLREIVRDPAAARPTPELRQVLDRLANIPNLDVTIISGRTPEDLETFLGEYDTFGLIGEHGAALRRPHSREWEQLDRNVSYAWKQPVREILALYAQSTPGTHVEDKRTSLVWHYRRADPEFGDWKARELVLQLSSIVANEPVTIRHGKKIVEITSAQVNKGAAVTQVLAQRDYDLVLLAGDDTTDETMFRLTPEDHQFITIHVGAGETQARHRLDSPATFRRFLMGAVTVD